MVLRRRVARNDNEVLIDLGSVKNQFQKSIHFKLTLIFVLTKRDIIITYISLLYIMIVII